MGKEGLGHESLRTVLRGTYCAKCSRPRLADKHSLRSSCIPAPAFEALPAAQRIVAARIRARLGSWWARRDSNPQSFRNMVLSHARIPIPPLAPKGKYTPPAQNVPYDISLFFYTPSPPTRTRTWNQLLKRQLLYQLSYRRIICILAENERSFNRMSFFVGSNRPR